MATEKEKVEKIKQVFFEYARENELSAFDTSSYFARQILPDESFVLRRKVIENPIELGALLAVN
jgi:hypothetical protein